jgi:hypothetical protein
MRNIATHLALLAGIAALLALCMVYPFLPGGYDSLAFPFSTMAQVFGLVGLVLVPGGLLWLAAPRFGFALAIWSTVVGAAIALILALVATLSVGNALGVLTLGALAFVLAQVTPGLKRLKHAEPGRFHPAPLYLVGLPVIMLAAQLFLVAPMTRSSRDRAIANAGELIAEIEQHRASYGRYPISLQAQHRDYNTDVVGIDRYLYAPQGDAYNLSFEQPRFLIDRFGTREWVVYNPRDEHRMYSHTAAHLSSPEIAPARQGWYASGQTSHAHWMYFLFD